MAETWFVTMVCDWCIKHKQTLMAQNVLSSAKFIDGFGYKEGWRDGGCPLGE